jgi:hypothetical protein
MRQLYSPSRTPRGVKSKTCARTASHTYSLRMPPRGPWPAGAHCTTVVVVGGSFNIGWHSSHSRTHDEIKKLARASTGSLLQHTSKLLSDGSSSSTTLECICAQILFFYPPPHSEEEQNVSNLRCATRRCNVTTHRTFFSTTRLHSKSHIAHTLALAAHPIRRRRRWWRTRRRRRRTTSW